MDDGWMINGWMDGWMDDRWMNEWMVFLNKRQKFEISIKDWLQHFKILKIIYFRMLSRTKTRDPLKKNKFISLLKIIYFPLNKNKKNQHKTLQKAIKSTQLNSQIINGRREKEKYVDSSKSAGWPYISIKIL